MLAQSGDAARAARRADATQLQRLRESGCQRSDGHATHRTAHASANPSDDTRALDLHLGDCGAQPKGRRGRVGVVLLCRRVGHLLQHSGAVEAVATHVLRHRGGEEAEDHLWAHLRAPSEGGQGAVRPLVEVGGYSRGDCPVLIAVGLGGS